MGDLAYIGIDPGVRGALALIDANSRVLVTGQRVPDPQTAVGFITLAQKAAAEQGWTCVAALEKVSARPHQGVVSMFKFGQGIGWWEGALSALQIPYLLVAPRRWQHAVLDSGGGKDAKAKSLSQARRLWPDLDLKKTDDGLADALHLARYCLLNFKIRE